MYICCCQKKNEKKIKKSVPPIGMAGTKFFLKKKRHIVSACDRLTRVRQGLIPAI